MARGRVAQLGAALAPLRRLGVDESREGRPPGDVAVGVANAPQQRVGLEVSGHPERRVVRRVEGAEVRLAVLAADGLDVRHPADDRPPVGVRLVDQGVQRLVHQARRLVVHPEPPLLLHHLALALERAVVDGERAHPVRLEVEHRVQGLGGEVLVVHRDVVGGVGVGPPAVGLQDLVELLGAVLLRPVEHHVLEEVADAGDAGALVARADLEEGVEAHHRASWSGSILMRSPLESRASWTGKRSAGSVFLRGLTGSALHTAPPAPSHRLRSTAPHRGEDEAAPDTLRPTWARG
jgi:hypothetical protein